MLWKMNVSNSCDVSNTQSLIVAEEFSSVHHMVAEVCWLYDFLYKRYYATYETRHPLKA